MKKIILWALVLMAMLVSLVGCLVGVDDGRGGRGGHYDRDRGHDRDGDQDRGGDRDRDQRHDDRR